MKTVSVLILTLLFLNSCDSETESLIAYTDINPDKKITSIISYPWTPDEVTKNNIIYLGGPGPNSTIGAALALVTIDLNKDTHADFDLGVRHAFEDAESGQPNDEFMIYIGSWDYNQVSLTDKDLGYIKKYTYGDELDLESFGSNARYSLNFPGGFLIKKDLEDDLVNIGEFYIGVKVNINDKWHFGWILVETEFLNLTIKEFALSKTPDRQIKAGQRD